VTSVGAALHHNFKWGASVAIYASLHAWTLVMLAILWATFYSVIRLFNE
jgi:hypothetical protein